MTGAGSALDVTDLAHCFLYPLRRTHFLLLPAAWRVNAVWLALVVRVGCLLRDVVAVCLLVVFVVDLDF